MSQTGRKMAKICITRRKSLTGWKLSLKLLITFVTNQTIKKKNIDQYLTLCFLLKIQIKCCYSLDIYIIV